MAAPPPGHSNPPPEPPKFKYSGFTHILFFSGPSPTGNDTFDLQALKNSIKEEKKRKREIREKKRERKKEETNEEKDKRNDEEYGLYYISVTSELRRGSRSVQRIAKGIIGNQESKRDYSEQIKDGYRQIAYNYEEEGTRDYICVFGTGEGIEPAIAVAQILSKVGVIQAWAFEENFSLVRKLTTSKKYTDEQRENFRRVRTQFARVDLFCLLGKLTKQTIDQLGKNIDVCKRCRSTVADASHSKVIESHQPGIGAERGLVDTADSAVAFTFESRVVQTLKRIVNEWNEGDYITLIGYSRGAAAAMVLARYIKLMGIPCRGDAEEELSKQVKLLIRKHGDSNCSDFADIKGRRDGERREVLVTRLILLHVQSTFLAIDIIHSYLSSDPVATTLFSLHKDNVIFESSDARQVICCYSADESRALFPPTQHVPSRPSPQEDHAHFAIFCGDHSDIGGASGSSLCYIPLRFAIIKAHTEEPRLRFRKEFLIDHFLDPHHLHIQRTPPLLPNNEVDYDHCRVGDPNFLRRADQLDSKCNISKPKDLKWKML
ncbi:hypothetical protein ACEPAH_3810 [Sanghuangporus vaninii]